MRRFITICLMAFCMAASAQQKYKEVRDIPYTNEQDAYAQERCKLDVYYPEGKTDCPVVVWFHGGGLEGGNKFIPSELKECGYVVVGVNYRLLPKCTPAQCIDDAAAATAWAYKHAEQYGGSHRKVFVSGHSAGGYLTDMIGLDKQWLRKYGVDADSLRALIPFSGQCVTHYNVRKLQGLQPLQLTIDNFAPMTFIRKDAPPIVIISGDREMELYGRYEEQAFFWRMLKLAGHPDATLYEMQGYSHGDMAAPAFHILKQTVRRLAN
ncbi:MAG: alpha/beta hydrolase [Bacteroidaceae bacterium]|nr:alpha/beta hydrolase [Bacteroidaceae bacterium]